MVLYSKEQFRDVTQSPSWAGGLYDGRIRLPVAGRIDEKARDAARVAVEMANLLDELS